MKEVKAYIRCQKAESVIEALEALGINDITLIDVMGVGQLADPHSYKYSVKCVEKYSEVAKLEVVCSDDNAAKVVKTIQEKAFTGLKGDGIIYVSPVDITVKIRSGTSGPDALS